MGDFFLRRFEQVFVSRQKCLLGILGLHEIKWTRIDWIKSSQEWVTVMQLIPVNVTPVDNFGWGPYGWAHIRTVQGPAPSGDTEAAGGTSLLASLGPWAHIRTVQGPAPSGDTEAAGGASLLASLGAGM